MRLAILFGAGASFGCGATAPRPIPLGRDLYEELRGCFPETWGKLITDAEGAAFRAEPPFEKGMEALREANDERLQLLLTDMAIYFTEFVPTSADNQYGKLIDHIGSDRLDSTVFASLNYDCLFEMTAGARSIPVNYCLDTMAPATAPGAILLLKPHGSCNFVMQGLGAGITMKNVTMSGMGGYYEGPLEARHPNEIAALYTDGPSMPPAISLYTTGKASLTGPRAITAIRERWRSSVAQADVVIPIGVRVVLADNHVWEPIVDSRADVWFVGGQEGDFADLQDQLKDRLTVLGPTFAEAEPAVARRLHFVL